MRARPGAARARARARRRDGRDRPGRGGEIATRSAVTRRRDSGEIAAGLRPLATAEVSSREALDANRCDRRATYILTHWLMLKHINACATSFVRYHPQARGRRAPSGHAARAMPSTLGLYRQLLRVSTVWPSSNRGKIMQEIRAGAPPSYAQPCDRRMHTWAPCTLGHGPENPKHARAKQRRSFAPLPRRISTEPARDRRHEAAEDVERSQHCRHVETSRPEASANSASSAPRHRRVTLRAA